MSTRQTLASLLRHGGSSHFSPICTRCPLVHSLSPQGTSQPRRRHLSSSPSTLAEEPFVRPGVLANVIPSSITNPAKSTDTCSRQTKPTVTVTPRDIGDGDGGDDQKYQYPTARRSSTDKKGFGLRPRSTPPRPLVRRPPQPASEDGDQPEAETELWRGGRRPDWQPGWKSRYPTAPDALKYDPRIQLGRTTTATPTQPPLRSRTKSSESSAKERTKQEITKTPPSQTDPINVAAVEFANTDPSRHVSLDTELHNLPKVCALPKKNHTRIVGWSGVQLENVLQPMASTPHAVYRSAYFLLRAAPLSALPERKPLPFPQSRLWKRDEPKVIQFAYTATKQGVSKLATVRNRARKRLKAAVDLVVNRSVGLKEGEHGWDLVSTDWLYIGQVSVDILSAPLPVLIDEVAAALRDLQSKAGKHHNRTHGKKPTPLGKK